MGRILGLVFTLSGVIPALGAPPSCLITVEVHPADAGAVRGAGAYPLGATVELYAEPFPGFAFLCWTEEETVVGQEPRLTFTATCNRSLMARFVPVFFLERLSGIWSGEIELLPGVGLERMRLRLQSGFLFGHNRLGFGLDTRAGPTGPAALIAEASAEAANLQIGGRAYFDPTVPALRSSFLGGMYRTTTLTFLCTVWHRQKAGIVYTASFRWGPMALTADFTEGITEGITFSHLVLRLRDVPLGCALVGTGTLSFAKDGFQYLELFIRDPIRLDCCGLLFDALVRHEASRTIVELRCRSRLFGEACLRLYGNVLWSDGTFSGIEAHGFRIRCRFVELADRPYWELDLVTAFDPLRLPWAGFQKEEFECWRLRFSMPGCCGAKASAELALYFAHTASLGGLSRVLAGITVPLWVGLELGAKLETSILAGLVQLRFTWSFES